MSMPLCFYYCLCIFQGHIIMDAKSTFHTKYLHQTPLHLTNAVKIEMSCCLLITINLITRRSDLAIKVLKPTKPYSIVKYDNERGLKLKNQAPYYIPQHIRYDIHYQESLHFKNSLCVRHSITFSLLGVCKGAEFYVKSITGHKMRSVTLSVCRGGCQGCTIDIYSWWWAGRFGTLVIKWEFLNFTMKTFCSASRIFIRTEIKIRNIR